MKKYTKEEIAQQLMDQPAIEFEFTGHAFYYIHIAEDGTLLPYINGAAETFMSRAAYAEDMEDIDDIYDCEGFDNADFMEVAEDLANQVNSWIDEHEEA